MLQSIREHAQGWIAWAIVILIAIPFALWGIQSYFGGGAERVVAKVNGVDITQQELNFRYQNTRIRLREQLGAAYDPALFDAAAMRRDVLDAIIRETVLLTTSNRIGLRASDDEIRLAILANPAFQADGRFDVEAYERALAVQGLVPAQFEQDLRQRLVGSQLQRAVNASELVTGVELAERLRLLQQERRVSFLRIRGAELLPEEPPSDADITAYYEASQSRFLTPEKVKLEYLVLNADTLGAAAPAPSEDELRQLYESRADRFRVPERRVIRHILVTLGADSEADEEEQARQTISEARRRILDGEAFTEVARAVSEDPESAGKGGLIGEIESGIMDPVFDKVAFALEEGAVSDPVRTPFGYHLIRVDRILPASAASFAEVKDQLAAEAAQQRFEGLYFDWAERLATLAYEATDTLSPASETLGLQIQTSDWVPRTGGEGLLGNPRVLSAAFSDEVLRQGLNSDLIEPEPGVLEAIVLRVVDHQDAAVRPLGEVRDEIVAALRAEQSQRAAEELGARLVQRLKEGESLDDVAGDWDLTDAGIVDRASAALPPAVRALAFTMPHPSHGQGSYGSTPLGNGDVAVVAVTEVRDGSVADEASSGVEARERDVIHRAIAAQYASAMLDHMAQHAKIARNLEPIADVE